MVAAPAAPHFVVFARRLCSALDQPRGMVETMPLGTEILADQIRRALRGESWHGPSVREVLAVLTGGYTLVLRRVRGEQAELVARGGLTTLAEVDCGPRVLLPVRGGSPIE